MKEKSLDRKIFRSLDEFEEICLPNYHREKFLKDRRKKTGMFGTGFATELLEDIKHKLES